MLQMLFCIFFQSLLCGQEIALPPPPPTSLYGITVPSITGGPVKLAGYQNRVLLIVNIVPAGPLAKQLAELQSLYLLYEEDGLSILAFPSNDFVVGTPYTIDAIRAACFDTYHVSFPVFAPVSVTGSYKSPVYQFLTNTNTNPIFGGDVTWNFVKFLVDRNGKVVGRFNSTVSPEDQKIKDAIQRAMSG